MNHRPWHGPSVRGRTHFASRLLRIDRGFAARVLEAVSPHAVEAALEAAEQVDRAVIEQQRAVERELEEAQYEASLAARRYELVDPGKRHVARELEARWNTALERGEQIGQHLVGLDAERASRPRIERSALMELAQDLPAVWNAPTTSMGTKQRLLRVLIEEVMIELDDEANQTVVTIHWVGGRHSETRVARVRTGCYPSDRQPNPVDVMRKLGGQRMGTRRKSAYATERRLQDSVLRRATTPRPNRRVNRFRRSLRRLFPLSHLAVTGLENRVSMIGSASGTPGRANLRTKVAFVVMQPPRCRHGFARSRHSSTPTASGLMTAPSAISASILFRESAGAEMGSAMSATGAAAPETRCGHSDSQSIRCENRNGTADDVSV